MTRTMSGEVKDSERGKKVSEDITTPVLSRGTYRINESLREHGGCRKSSRIHVDGEVI